MILSLLKSAAQRTMMKQQLQGSIATLIHFWAGAMYMRVLMMIFKTSVLLGVNLAIQIQLDVKLHTRFPCLHVQNGRQASVQNHLVASLQALAALAPAVAIQGISRP